MAHDVFISYASRDKASADAICARLEDADIRCWMAPRDVPIGADWASAIVDAITSSRVLVLVFSSESNASSHVIREVELAIRAEVVLAPFRIENVEPRGSLSYFISNADWLDAITPPLEDHLTILVGMLTNLLGTTAPDTSPSGDAETRAPVTPKAPRPRRSRPSKALLTAIAVLAFASLTVAGVIAFSGGGGSDAGSAVCQRGIKWRQPPAPYSEGALVATTDDAAAAIVFGGARFNFPSEEEYTALVGQTVPQRITHKDFEAIGVRPRDGLLVRERTLDGKVPGRLFLAEGGAAFEVRDPASLADLGLRARDAETVPTHGLDQVPPIPEAGTLLRIGTSDQVWVISGAVRRPATRVCTGAIVNQLPDDRHILDQIPIGPGTTTES